MLNIFFHTQNQVFHQGSGMLKQHKEGKSLEFAVLQQADEGL